MSWRIDNKGIHIDADSLCEAQQDIEAVERMLISTPRTVGEHNAESVRIFRQMLGAKQMGVLGAPEV